MPKSLLLVVAVLLTPWTSAVASEPLPTPLAQDLPVEVVMPLHDMDFGTYYMDTSPKLIVSLLEHAQNKAGFEEIAPLREQVAGYPYEQRLEQALRSKLTGDSVAPHLDIRFLDRLPQTADPKAPGSEQHEVMVIQPHFAIDQYYRFLTVDLLVAIEDREMREDGSLRYKDRFSRRYSLFFQLIDKKGAARTDRWMAMGRERLVAMFDQGVQLTAEMLAYDFSPQGRSEWNDWGKMRTLEVRGVKTWAYPIRQTDAFMLNRAGGSWYLGWEPVDESDPPIQPGP